jgi:hypothetical protein
MAGPGRPAQSWRDLPARLDPQVADWLVDAVAPGRRPGTWLDEDPPEGLLVGVQLHGVEGWLRRRAAQAGVVVTGLDAAVHAVLGRHQRAVADLAAAHAALLDGGVPHLVVKGPAVARWYADPSLRSSVDIDLVVAPARLEVALESLEGCGFELLDANWPLLQLADVHELTLRSPSGGALDLHWSLGPSPMAIDHSPPVEVLLSRAVPLEVGDIRSTALGDPDALVHLAVHAAASGGHRLVWLADLRAAIAATAPDRRAVRDVAREWGAVPAVELMVGRVARVLGPPGPDEAALPGSPTAAWSLVDRMATRFSAPERVGTGAGLSRLVARSCRSTGPRSASALVGKSVRRLVARSGDTSPASLGDPASAGSARHPVGGAQGRREFLSWVRTAQRPEGR